MASKRDFLKAAMGIGAVVSTGGASLLPSLLSIGAAIAPLAADEPKLEQEGDEGVEWLRGAYRASGVDKDAFWKLDNLIDDEDSKLYSNKGLPAWIETKKSWSPAFKEATIRNEKRRIDELRRRLHNEQDYGRKLAQALGLI